ncbi:protein ALP1-like, partial [Oryzias melastigma]|uniref:protein ALP1-like n=1 Tax=Oryzias melastigma TaxID=30732 RepID=UPI00168D6F49
LCDAVGPLVAPAVRCPRQPVAVKKRIAIAIYKLAACAEYRVVAETFGVSKTTVHRCVYGVCEAICHKLMKKFITLPKEEEAQQIAQRNYESHGLPQIYGAIDGSHIPIRAPRDGYRDYVNRKGWASIVLQAVVDDRLMIRDISVGSPGSAHDAAVLATSSLFRHPEKHPKASMDIEGVQVPLLLAGDPAYPLLPWIMKGYAGPNLTEPQEMFNEHLSAIRVKVEHTFGHLKTRWRVLAKTSDIHHDFMPKIVATCYILHNMCEEKRQQLPPAPQHTTGHPLIQPQERHSDEADAMAVEIRQALVNHLSRPH